MTRKRIEQPESETEVIEQLPRTEVPDNIKLENRVEILEESQQEIQEEITGLKEKIEPNYEEQPAETEEDFGGRERTIAEYQRRYLPKYLQGKPSLVFKALNNILKIVEKNTDIEGEENIPEEACLVVCNHFGGGRIGLGDSGTLLDVFKEKNIHLGVGKNIWWDRSPIHRWLFKKMGTLPVAESLAHLTDEEKEEALSRQGNDSKKVYRQIIDSERQGKTAANADFIRQAVAVLAKGEAVGFYPEGLWLDPQGLNKLGERQELKQGYRGMELIASQYKKLTGKDLKIIPTAFVEDRKTGSQKFIVGKPLVPAGDQGGLNDTDWTMTKIASMLPEEMRGYYKEEAEKMVKEAK